MIPLFIFVEDRLSDAVIRTLLRQSPLDFGVTGSITGGVAKIKEKIKAINESARGMPFLVLIDQDSEECAPSKISQWLPEPKHPNLLFRVAVREVESWLMADAEGFAKFLGIKPSLLPLNMEEVENPKEFLMQLARKSRKKEIREAIVPKPVSKARIGPDYNGSLIRFVWEDWDINKASQRSNSLKRTIESINHFEWQK